MILSSATGVYQQRGDSPLHRDLNEVITVLHEVGYNAFDLSLASLEQPEFILKGDDWERKIGQLGETAAKLGVTFCQSHLPFVPLCSIAASPEFQKPGYEEQFFTYTRRAYQASQMLQIPWTVLHPLTFPEHNYENKATLEANHALYDQYVELGVRLGVGTAIENMTPPWHRKLGMTYCQHYDQLIELVESFAEPMVGICWDTGHANLVQLDQERALRAIGGRLKVLHINDNHAQVRDEHILPFMGDVDWDAVLRGLAAIGYEGSFSYETGKTSANAYGSLQREFIKLAYRNGLYLMERYEALKRERAIDTFKSAFACVGDS